MYQVIMEYAVKGTLLIGVACLFVLLVLALHHLGRHTAATWIGRSGKLQLVELCRMFGWSNPRMAMVYFNATAEDMANRL